MAKKETILTGDTLANVKRGIRIINFKGMKYFWAFWFVFNLLIITTQFIYTVIHRGDLVKLMEVCVTCIFVVQFCQKLVIFYWKQDMIDDMFKTVEELFLEPATDGNDDEEIKLLANTVWFVYGHMLSALAVAGYVMLSPISKSPPGTKTLPIQTWMPFDTNRSPAYEIIVVLFTLDSLVVVYTDVMYDYCFLYFAQNVLVQFKLLKKLLLNAAGEGDLCERFHSDAFQAKYFKEIVRCIDHHRLLTEFSRDLDKFASANLGVYLLLTVATAVVVQFLIYWDSENKIRCFKLLLIFGAVFAQVMIYAYVGSELEAVGLDIATAAFHTQWYVGRKPIRDALTMVQVNAQIPLRITAWVFMIVNNTTIIWIYRIAFSVFTLLQSLQQKDSY